MINNKHILMSLTLLSYSTTGYSMNAPFVDLRTKTQIIPFGTRKPLPSFQLLSRMSGPDYQPDEDDERQLVNIYAPFKKDERPLDALPKMILAASAYLTLFNTSKEDRTTTMNDIAEMVEATEDYYHDQCTPDQKELNVTDKKQIAHYLHCSPFIYRGTDSTLFYTNTPSKTPLRRQFDELNERLMVINGKLTSVEQFAKSTQGLASYMSPALQTQVQAHMTLDELQTLLKLSKKLLELNKEKTIERMKSINEAQKNAIERCKSVVETAQKDLDNAGEEAKADAATELVSAQQQLIETQERAKTLQTELDAITKKSWFGFSGH